MRKLLLLPFCFFALAACQPVHDEQQPAIQETKDTAVKISESAIPLTNKPDDTAAVAAANTSQAQLAYNAEQLGRTALSAGQNARARRSFEMAYSLGRREPHFLNTYGDLMFREKETEKAAALFREALVQDVQLPATYYNLCITYQAGDHYDSIEKYTRAYLQRFPNDTLMPRMVLLRAEAHLGNRRYTDAADAYTVYLKMKPQDAYAYMKRGVARGYQRRFPEAFADEEKAQQLQPGYPDAERAKAFIANMQRSGVADKPGK